MKPGFALILSQDGISLLHRANGGWRVLGNADPQDPDLDKSLRYLQRTAVELSGGQFATKLVIPNTQILYRHVEAVGFTDELRTALIHASLEDSTPYRQDELVFDWADAGDGMAHVAVVAIQTLKEAEKFAREHRFNPVSFVAMPESGLFSEEPFFGETDLSETLLSDGDRVEPDDEPIVLISEPEISETPVISVPEISETDPGAADAEPVFKHVEAAVLPPAPSGETASDATAFSTRRKTDHPIRDEGPLDLKWVTPRIAFDQNTRKPSDEKARISDTAEITEMAVTAPILAGETKRKKKSAKKTRAKPVETANPEAKPTPAAILPNISSRSASQYSGEIAEFGTLDAEQNDPKRGFLKIGVGLGIAASIVLVGLLTTGVIGSTDRNFKFWQSSTASTANLGEGLTATAVVASASFDGSEKANDDAAPVAGVEMASLTAPDISTVDLALPTHEEIAEARDTPETLETLTPDRAQAAYGLTGIWQLAPLAPNDPATGRITDLYVASIDRPIIIQDAVALPAYAASRPDHNLGFVTAPAPAGTVFKLDERGLVTPSAKGTLAPEGHRVYAGKPAYVPKLRPDTAPVAAAEPFETTKIVGIRPLPRPDDLVAKTQKARLGGRTLAEVGESKPLPRPDSPQEVVQAAAPEKQSKLVIASSRRPLARPQNFKSAVDAALAAVAIEAALADAAKSAPAPAVKAPPASNKTSQKVASVASSRSPNLPTRANVAKEATVKNAIHLSAINLIGVYGSNSDRRALVRLKSGRYVKVQIGDRLDGGRVAAIGSGELKYVKSGRNVTLKMPTG
ncbi:MAG: hypothetical protein ACU0CA_14700 [Paracoccaceae bacterium]